jgi:hypothetical protein
MMQYRKREPESAKHYSHEIHSGKERRMKRRSLGVGVAAVLLLASAWAFGQEAKLPVVALKYDGGYGSEEIEEEDQIEPSSHRHTVLLRIKEELGEGFTVNLYSAVSRKEYLQEKGSYLYFYLNPDAIWYLTDRLRWYTALRTKWIFYDELDSDGKVKDYGSYLAKTDLTIKAAEGLKLIPSVQGIWDVYQNPEKSIQTYIAGLNITSQIAGWSFSGRCRGTARFPLSPQSTALFRFNTEFGLSASWDPNE